MPNFKSIFFCLGGLATGGFALATIQKFTGMRKAEANRMHESLIEKEFRHRTAFLNDMHIYQFIALAGILYSMSYLMHLNRKMDHHEREIAECQKPKQK